MSLWVVRASVVGMTTTGLRIGMVTFDTTDAPRLASWWAEQLGGTVQEHPGYSMVLPAERGGLVLGFQEVPDPTPGKNRLHLDVGATDVPATVERLVGAGAAVVGEHTMGGGFGWTVLADPDGNQFCVAPADQH